MWCVQLAFICEIPTLPHLFEWLLGTSGRGPADKISLSVISQHAFFDQNLSTSRTVYLWRCQFSPLFLIYICVHCGIAYAFLAVSLYVHSVCWTMQKSGEPIARRIAGIIYEKGGNTLLCAIGFSSSKGIEVVSNMFRISFHCIRRTSSEHKINNHINLDKPLRMTVFPMQWDVWSGCLDKMQYWY